VCSTAGRRKCSLGRLRYTSLHMCTGAYLTLSHNSFLGPFSAYRSCLWFVYDLRLGGIIFHKKREKEIQVRNRLLEQVYLLSAGCLSLLHCVCSGLSRSSPVFFPFSLVIQSQRDECCPAGNQDVNRSSIQVAGSKPIAIPIRYSSQLQSLLQSHSRFGHARHIRQAIFLPHYNEIKA